MKKLFVLLLVFVLMINLTPVSANEIDPQQNVSDWKRENGYDFPVYGTTSVDLSPISDYLNLLKENNIFCRRYFYPLITAFTPYRGYPSASPENLPVATKLAEQVLCLPMHHALTEEDILRILNIVII